MAAGLRGTPLHEAARGGDADIVGRLLNKGADADAASPNVGTPLQVAERVGHEKVIEILRKRARKQ